MIRALVVGCLAWASLATADPKPKAADVKRAQRCTYSGQCVVAPKSCCGHCGNPTPDDAIAWSADYLETHAAPGCEGVSCPRCHSDERDTLVATCEAHQCVVKDLAKMSLTACTRDDECVAEIPQCCACSWAVRTVAVRKDKRDALRRMTCGTGIGCPACALTGKPPAARCDKGRCALVDDGPGDESNAP